jgi:hypothetical protein
MLWRDQIVKDISNVLDNNEVVNGQILDMKLTGVSLPEMSNFIADIYYKEINDVLDTLDDTTIAWGFVAEICTNLGVAVFEDLAREWVEE